MRVNGHWVHSIDPYFLHFPDSWPIGGIFWYGIAYISSFFAVFLGLYFYSKKARLPFDREQIGTFLLYLILGVVAGGRLGFVLLYDFPLLWESPLQIFYIWQGGMSSHGGFVGVVIALYLFARQRHLRLLALTDICCSLAPIGFLLGRMANFINGEVYGRVTAWSWGVIFPRSAPYAGFPVELLSPRHPSQLYEALLEGALLLIFVQWRFWAKKFKPFGQLTGKFLIAYGSLRIVVERFREPDASLIFSLSRGQFYSVFLLIVGVGILLFLRRFPVVNASR